MKKTILIAMVLALGLATEVSKADFFFGEPENLGPTVNTEYVECAPSISSDGLTLYFSDAPWNLAPGGYGGVDIWIATRPTPDQPWDSVTNLGEAINTQYSEGTPYISTDGLSLFFSSDRAGGSGDNDLWISTRTSLDADWSAPENLGSTINSNKSELFPCVAQDGLELYFYSSGQPGGLGIGDLWVSRRSSTSESWGVPENLGPNVNSSKDDGWPCLLYGGLTLIFNSNRAISPEDYDLYMSSRVTAEEPWGESINLGEPLNSSSNDGGPSISSDGQWLFFHSNRPGGQGDLDLWQASIEPVVDLNGDGIVDAADMCIVVDHWGENYPLCDVGPMPWGDGVVDVEDLIVLAEHLFEVYPPAETIEVESEWVLAWGDEFDGESIDLTKWTHMIGDGTDYGQQPGWGNNEKQFYTDDPANSGIIIDDEGNSVLFIEAIDEQLGKSEYTSAKLTTESLFTFRFGKIEARIKLPYSQGIWPAFWMLGSNKPQIGWPGCGEIDIMEMLGGAEETVYGNIHYVNADHEHDEDLGFSILDEGKYSDDYHIYSMEWSPGNIKWLVDGEYFHEIEITDDMKEFLRDHYLILNVAVGGYWPGYPDETSVFPQRMYIDYIRIYQDTTLTDIPDEPALDVDEETMGLGSTSALAAINSDFTPFHDIKIVKYGPASPDMSVSTVAIDGKTSILAVYGGGNWGGFWFELDSPIDMSQYHNGNLIVMLDVPENIADFEVKLESTGGFGSVNLLDYPSEPVDNNYDKFTIPLVDFVALGLKLESLTIPFALWNPKDIGGEYTGGNVLVDNIYFEFSD